MITGTVESDSNNISALIWLTLSLSLSPPYLLGVSVDSAAVAIFNNITLIGYDWNTSGRQELERFLSQLIN